MNKNAFLRKVENMHKNAKWEYDVNSYARLQKMLISIHTPEFKKYIIDRLHQIEERWPNHVKVLRGIGG